MKQRTLKNRILLLALALLLLIPTSITLAKYTAVNDVGTVTLNITVPVLDQNWKDELSTLNVKPTTLVVGSFDEENGKLSQPFQWEVGTSIGERGSSNVRLFISEDKTAAYILAKGGSSVMFPTNSSRLFLSENLSELTQIQFNKINTSSTTNMEGMFSSCSALTSLDLSNFDTKNVTDMENMFGDCQSLTSLDLSNFDTKNVTRMTTMFAQCNALTNLNVSSFNTSSVTSMNSMFSSCSALTSLDLRSFDTSKVTDMGNMFLNCSKLKQVTLGKDFKFVGTNGYLPEQTESNITGADGKWYTDQATYYTPAQVAEHQNPDELTGPTTYYAVGTEAPAPPPAVLDNSFRSQIPETATKLVLGSWNDLKVHLPENTTWGSGIIYVGEQVNGTYSDQVKLFMGADGTTAYVLAKGSLPVTFPKDSVYLFSIPKLTDIKFDNIDTLNVKDMRSMFFDCSKLESLDLSRFNTQNVSYMSGMFHRCRNLASLNVSSFDTRNVNNMSSMFDGCSNLTSLDLSSFKTYNVTAMRSMFSECSNLKSLDLSSFNTIRVTSMSYMFYGCSNLASLTWKRFLTGAVTNMSYMFYGCSELTYLDLSSFQTHKTPSVSSYGMFTGCNKLEKVKYGNRFTQGGILPTPTSDNIPGADGKWYINSATGFTPAEVQNRHSKGLAATYYAVASKAPQH